MKKKICDLADDEHFIVDGAEFIATPLYDVRGRTDPEYLNRYAVRAKELRARTPYILHTHPAYKAFGNVLTTFRTFSMGLEVESVGGDEQ